MQNEKQNKTNMGPQDKTNGQNPQNKKKDQAQNKSSRPEQYGAADRAVRRRGVCPSSGRLFFNRRKARTNLA